MKFAILDRDGVINHDSDAYIKSPDEWVALPGSIDAIARLSRAGWRVVIASNQSGLARGLFTADTLNAIHDKLRSEVNQAGGHIDAIFVCPHGPDDNCLCRKPLPGLFHDIARRFDINLNGVHAAGDSLRDIQAAHQAGCTTWLVLTGNGAKARDSGQLPPETRICNDLASVVDSWLNED